MIILGIFLLIILILFLFFSIHSYYLGRFVYHIDSPGNLTVAINDKNLKKFKDRNETSAFKFLVLGDIQSSFKNLNKLAYSNAGENISFIIQTGDLFSHADEGHYSLVIHELNKYNSNLPILVVPGNHDIKEGEFLFHNYFGSRQYYFFCYKCLFIIIDNSLGPPYTTQFQWLKKTLSDNYPKAKHTFIFMHRESIEWERGKPHPALDDYAPFFRLLHTFQVDYVFSGHLHNYQRLEKSGTIFISNGLTSKMNGFMKISPNYITLVKVSADGIQDSKIPVNQSLINRFYGWYLDTSVAHFYPWLTRVKD